MFQKNSYIFLHKNDCKTPYTDIYIDLLSINFNLLYHCFWSDQWFWNLYCNNNNMIAKYIVLFNIISVVSDNILHICIPRTPLDIKKFIVLLHSFLAYNSPLVRYKVYLCDPRKCFCTSWCYGEAYENFSIDPVPCQKNPIKNKLVTKLSAPTTRRKLHWKKAWKLKFA